MHLGAEVFKQMAGVEIPAAIVNRLNRALRETLADPHVVQPVQNQGLNPESVNAAAIRDAYQIGLREMEGRDRRRLIGCNTREGARNSFATGHAFRAYFRAT